VKSKQVNEKNVINNFRYKDKFITECNASIMGKKTYLPNIQGGEFKSSENLRTVGSKGMSTTKTPHGTFRGLGSLFSCQKLNIVHMSKLKFRA
jgi:hypothetical protein